MTLDRRTMVTMPTDDSAHRTQANPSGTVSQCTQTKIHPAHEYQAQFGDYFDVYCPGIYAPAQPSADRDALLDLLGAAEMVSRIGTPSTLDGLHDAIRRVRRHINRTGGTPR